MKKKKERNRECDICGGTGQVSYFKGVSRFLLSTEECDACAGTGYVLDSAEDHSESSNPDPQADNRTGDSDPEKE